MVHIYIYLYKNIYILENNKSLLFYEALFYTTTRFSSSSSFSIFYFRVVYRNAKKNRKIKIYTHRFILSKFNSKGSREKLKKKLVILLQFCVCCLSLSFSMI